MMLEIALFTPLQWLVDRSDEILKFWHGAVGSWGLAIILLTFTVRLLILPLTFKSVKSMQKLQVLQPEMKKIQERFKEDRQRMNQEMMKFYQENKVNPLGSCLPLLLQIPFFIALFYLLRSGEFKADIQGAESFLFIPDLAAPLTDEPLILALMIVLYVGTQLIASLITMVGGDKTQQRIMLALPFVFVIFIINFEAGLIVYWITTNVWTIGQQLVVRKLYPRPAVLSEAGVDATQDSQEVGKPVRGKPARASGTAVVASGGTNGGPSKPPPGSPRKKKKRSGRRR
ncbi:MAG: YidC/Oxa1 family membrane protein insertase [Actinomycetota bacterium]|nr:YidC/Oxa1 family membrane protein insertase [Actinomycetota bacterium]